MIPAPNCGSLPWAPTSVAVVMIRLWISPAVRSGRIAFMSAASPATIGAAMDVPFRNR